MTPIFGHRGPSGVLLPLSSPARVARRGAPFARALFTPNDSGDDFSLPLGSPFQGTIAAMRATEPQAYEQLAELGRQVRLADGEMTAIAKEIAQYRLTHGLSFTKDKERTVNVSDSHLRELEARFAAARQRFYSLLNERAGLLKLIRQGG